MLSLKPGSDSDVNPANLITNGKKTQCHNLSKHYIRYSGLTTLAQSQNTEYVALSCWSIMQLEINVSTSSLQALPQLCRM